MNSPSSVAPSEQFHPLTSADRDAMATVRQALAAAPALPVGLAARAPYDAFVLQTPADPTVHCEAGSVGGVAGWWYRPVGAPADCAILYLHGGAYVAGSAAGYQHLGSQLAVRARINIFAPDYRLAPEHPFPAAVDDALAAYRGLAALGQRRLALCGDSAGGGLTLVTLANLRDTMSAWTDLALTSPSLETRSTADPILQRANLAPNADFYLQGQAARDPQASPVYGKLAGLPPVQLHVGTDEVLLDDSRRYAARAQAAGVSVELHVWEGLPHVFPSLVGTLQAADEALVSVASFLRHHLGGK